MPYLLIFSGLILMVTGFVMLIQRSSKPSTEKIVVIEKSSKSEDKPNQKIIEQPISKTTSSLKNIIQDTEKGEQAKENNSSTEEEAVKKGRAFENYVVKKFDSKYFELIEWRSDKFHEGIYASSSKLPDLEYQFTLKKHTERFAVECKYRSSALNGIVEFANDKQLKRYQEYAKEKEFPVFIVLGVGGQPDKPERLFIIPAPKISSGKLSWKDLQPFEKYPPEKNFFYDFEEDTLK